jgi:hypothetical protein
LIFAIGSPSQRLSQHNGNRHIDSSLEGVKSLTR